MSKRGPFTLQTHTHIYPQHTDKHVVDMRRAERTIDVVRN